jgi:pseudouridine-5'-phosphate glycosidase/pseudouridine kinase
MRHYGAEPLGPDGIVSVNGAGDTFLGALVAQLARGKEVGEEVVGVAQKAAVETLGWGGGVSEDIGGGGVAREKIVDKKSRKKKRNV